VAPTRILGALLAPSTAGIEWLGRLVKRDEPAAEKPGPKIKKKKARRKRARDRRRQDRELRSRRPAS
jgi:hypothetical protein